jgi:hypothetical protein
MVESHLLLRSIVARNITTTDSPILIILLLIILLLLIIIFIIIIIITSSFLSRSGANIYQESIKRTISERLTNMSTNIYPRGGRTF